MSAAWIDYIFRFPDRRHSLETNVEARQGGDFRGQIEGPYRDDALLEHGDQAVGSQMNGGATDHAVDRGTVVQSLQLHNEGNEWRDIPSGA